MFRRFRKLTKVRKKHSDNSELPSENTNYDDQHNSQQQHNEENSTYDILYARDQQSHELQRRVSLIDISEDAGTGENPTCDILYVRDRQSHELQRRVSLVHISEDTGTDEKQLAIVVAAIDFGTSYTGYAFSFHHDQKRIFTSTHGGKLVSDKVPTTILLKPDETFDSFGVEAQNKYATLAESDIHKDWFYFETFKTALYQNNSLTRDIEIVDSELRPMAAMKVFSMAISYIRELAVDIICNSKDGIESRDIKWIITIPAISSDSARQFMREAAMNAGITSDRLRLVLEPEAASLFCTEQPSQKVVSTFSGATMIERFPIGHKYILADLGGGTADICVHEILTDGFLREIYQATGGALGGTCVDAEFRQFLIKLVGADILMKFKSDFMDNYSRLLSEFQEKKSVFTGTTEQIVLNIPASLVELVNSEQKTTIDEIIPNTSFQAYLEFRPTHNKLIIKGSLMKTFFKPSIEGIIKLLRNILQETRDHNIKILTLVGGYSESPYLREIIQSEMTELKVLLEPEPRLAVLKGAVLMGYKPRTIKERRAQFTYGFSCMKPFIKGVHPEIFKTIHDKQIFCNCLFDKQIEKGQTLVYGQIFKSESLSSKKMANVKYRSTIKTLYKTTKINPMYDTEEEMCTKVGEIVMKPPETGWPDLIQYETHIIVRESEFIVKVFDKTTGAEYEAKFDFL